MTTPDSSYKLLSLDNCTSPTEAERKQTTTVNTSSSTQPDFTVITAPFTTKDLIKEQKEDAALQPLWDRALDPLDPELVVRSNVLMLTSSVTPKKKLTRS